VENVAALLVRGIDKVLEDLAKSRYDAEWDCIPASALGAPHQRDRVWIVAYPVGTTTGRTRARFSGEWRREDAVTSTVPNPQREGLEEFFWSREPQIPKSEFSDWWEAESPVCRVDTRVPDRLDRLHAIGNSLVPQIAELLGRRILAFEGISRES
jgi:DNA (cytosine-5)-methyltransferase 1